MHGLIMLTVKDLVITKYGEKAWAQICADAKCPIDYVHDQPYDDSIVYGLVKAASALLKARAEDVLEQVGYWFIVYIHKKTKYGQLLELMMSGGDLGDALSQVNKLHAHLLKVAHFPTIVSPTFKITHRKENRMRLHYTPGKESRCGLAPLVIGLVKGLGMEMLKLSEVKVSQIKTREVDGADVFAVEWTSPDEGNQTDNKDENGETEPGTISTTTPLRAPPKLGLNGKALDRLYPFHITFDKECNIIQAGHSIQRIVALEAGDPMSQFFAVREPEGCTFGDFKSIYAQRKLSPFTLAHDYDEQSQLLLHGEMVWCNNKQVICFACRPVLNSIEEARYLGITLSDFPLCDQAQARIFTTHATNAPAVPKLSTDSAADVDDLQSSLPMIGTSVPIPIESEPHLTHSFRSTTSSVNGNASTTPTNISTGVSGGRILKNLFGQPGKARRMAAAIPEELRIRKHYSADGPAEVLASLAPGSLATQIPMQKPRSASSSGPSGSSRMYDTVRTSYDRLRHIFTEALLEDSWDDFPFTCAVLELDMASNTPASSANQLSEAIVRFYTSRGKAQHLLHAIFVDHISSQKEESGVLFREESAAVRTFKVFIQQHAAHYVEHCIGDLLRAVDEVDRPLEVDPRMGASSSEIAKNVKQLLALAQDLIEHVSKSAARCPVPVRRVLRLVGREVGRRCPGMQLQAMSNLLILRFLSPAMVSPRESASKGSQRTLVLVTKLLNNLVNHIQFGDKEPHMTPFNAFVSPENLRLVQQFMQELVSDDHIAVAAAAESSAAVIQLQQQQRGGVCPFSGSDKLTPPVVVGEEGPSPEAIERYRELAALDEIRRSLLPMVPSLFATSSTKPKLQRVLQQLVSVFLCELQTDC